MQPSTYVEIGVFHGESLRLASPQTYCIGVDPNPRVSGDLPDHCTLVRSTSDEFFDTGMASDFLAGRSVDLALIDGLHLFEYALRDFINLEAVSGEASVIAIHDVIPTDAVTAARERTTVHWTGDVWKLLLCLAEHRPDLDITLVDVPPSGIALVRGLCRDDVSLKSHYKEIVDFYQPLEFDTWELRKDELLSRFGRSNEARIWSRLRELEKRAADAEARVRASEVYSKDLENLLQEVRSSNSWKMTSPWRAGGRFIRQYSPFFRNPLLESANLAKRFPWVRQLFERLPYSEGIKGFIAHRQRTESVYRMWIAKKESIPDSISDYRLTTSPLISLIVPVYDTDSHHLRACVDSVRNQLYPGWQLCLYDDASTSPKTRQTLAEIDAAGDVRISVIRGDTNVGISAASNRALAQATGGYVALLDHDDTLAPHALAEIAAAIEAHPDVKYIYSDEDKLDTSGGRVQPFFKPDWSPEYVLSQMYCGHLSVYRRSLLEDVGGFREGFEGSQDHDLLIRCLARLDQKTVVHIPKVLYHWRMTPQSTALNAAHKPFTEAASVRALDDYLESSGIAGCVERGPIPNSYRVKRSLPGHPLVSVVIPFRDAPALLEAAVRSVLDLTDYPEIELLLVDNASQEEGTLALVRKLDGDDRVRVLRYPHEFNYSAINNFAADHAMGDFLLLLNSDTEVIEAGWLTAMLEHGLRPEVGAVGAKLLYPDHRVQHAGVIVGLNGVAGHPFLGLGENDAGYFGLPCLTREVSAVTAACLLVRRDLYHSVGGLDERNLPVAFNDVDFCLRLRERDLAVIFTPYARLLHKESASRGIDHELARTDSCRPTTHPLRTGLHEASLA